MKKHIGVNFNYTFCFSYQDLLGIKVDLYRNRSWKNPGQTKITLIGSQFTEYA